MYNTFPTNFTGKKQKTFGLQLSKRFFYLCLMVVCTASVAMQAKAQTNTKFNDGYLSVYRVTSGATLAGTGTAIVVDEYAFSGASQSTPNFSVSVPNTFGSPNKRIVASGSATSAGAMSRTENGRYLIIPGYDTSVGTANTLFTLNAALRTINASGTVGAGVQGNGTTGFYANGSNNLRGGTSDDGSNFWAAGNGTGSSGTNGIQYSSNGTTITNVTASQNGRVAQIFNGQLYMSLAGALHQIGTGKPTTSVASTAFLTLNAGNTSIYSFAVSPDFLTVYTIDDGSSKGVYRYVYSGTYSGGAYSGGTWTNALVTAVSGGTGIAVDWSNYSFNASAANGARLFYCIPLSLFTALDNGTTAFSATTLRTITNTSPSFNGFRGLSFSPVKQTVSLGTNSPAASSKSVGTLNAVLFQFNLAATEGNSTIKKVVVNNSGTAVLGTDITSIRLYDDINGDGVINGSDSVLSTGTVSGANITFSSINLSSYITESSSKNFLVVGNIAGAATLNRTFAPSIVANKTINSASYTTNLANASGAYVTIGTTAPTGNTITIISAAPIAPTSGGNQSACTGATIPSLSATAGAGETIDWYAASSAGSALSSGSTTYATGATTAGTYTYYAEARNTTSALVSATRTAVTLTITQTVTPTVSASADDNTPAPGQTVHFTIASSTNVGTSPQYQWYKNNGVISGATSSNYNTSTYNTLDSFYVQLTSNATCASPASVNSNSITLTIDNSGCSGTPPTANATASSSNVCNGGSTTLSLTGLGAATGYTFQWQSSTTQNGTYSNTSGADTNSTLSVSNITTALWYKCVVTCTTSGLFAASNATQVSVTTNVTPNVTIATATNPSCTGASVNYIATAINGGGSPVYAWYLNGNLVSGQTTSIYTSSSFANNDQVYAILTSNYACLTRANDTSAVSTQTVTAITVASVSIASSANPSCVGSVVTLTATPASGVTSPSYQWYSKKNGIITGETNSTYLSSTLTNGDSTYVVLSIGSQVCVTGSPATSNYVKDSISPKLTPAVTIISSNNPVCISGGATFTATPFSGGTAPSYAWYKNGTLDNSQTGSTYTIATVANNDSVSVVLTSNYFCLNTTTATSNTVKETIVTRTTTTVTITSSPADTSGIVKVSNGSTISFTANVAFGGTPTYQWRQNGVNISGATNATYVATSFNSGDVFTCKIKSNYTCQTNGTDSTATSNSLTVTVLSNSPFTPGNLLVYRAGDNTVTLSGNGNIIYLDEYTQSGTFVQSKRITATTSDASHLSPVASGTATSEGALSLSTNGKYVGVPGYWSYVNAISLSTTSAATTYRVASRVDINQNVAYTKLTDWSTGNNPRSVVFNSDTTFYAAGGTGAIRYAKVGDTTSVLVNAGSGAGTQNFRVVNIFNSQLYASASSGTSRLVTIGTGTPTTSGQAVTQLSGDITSIASPYSYYFPSSNIFYIVDDGTKVVTKYIQRSNGSWYAKGTVTLDSAARGMTGFVNGSTVTLYLSYGFNNANGGGNIIYKINTTLDTLSLSNSYSKVYNSTGNTASTFKGICFTPTSILSQPSSATSCTGTTATFSVAMASGANALYAYQWQVFNGTKWDSLSNGAPYSNATTSTLSVASSIAVNGKQYRCLVTYMGNATLTSNAATLTVPTTVTPSVSISTTAASTICSGTVLTLTASSSTGGTSPTFEWFKNGQSQGTGNGTITFGANTLSSGNNAFTCIMTANNTCQTSSTVPSNSLAITVNASPLIGVSTVSLSTLCGVGSTTTAYNTNTSGGGVWSSKGTAVSVSTATGGAVGNVTATTTSGLDTLTYTKTASNGCASKASVAIAVATVATPATIVSSNGNSLCPGATTNLSGPTGGSWSTPSSSIVTVNTTTGVATASSAGGVGNATIFYKVVSGTCSSTSSYTITVSAKPATPAIAYKVNKYYQAGAGGAYCIGDTFTVIAKVSGTLVSGNWVSSNTSIATIGATSGLMSIVGTGGGSSTTITFTYTSPAGCTSSRAIPGVKAVVVCPAHRGGVSNEVLLTSSKDFTLYPNPARSTVSLQVEKLVGAGTIVVTDLYGKQVKTQALSMGTNTIDISNLAKGFYLVSTITEQGKTTKKLVVE